MIQTANITLNNIKLTDTCLMMSVCQAWNNSW